MQAWVQLCNYFKGHSPQQRNAAWVLAGILGIALLLRVYPLKDLNSGDLYFAEAQTMSDAALPFSQIASSCERDQGPLKFYFLRLMLYLGREEFLLRFPALFFDLASIVLLFFLGSSLFGRKAGLLASFLVAVSVWHIHYATSVRTYPLYTFSILASTIFLYRAVRSQGLRDWIFFTAASVFQFYAFYPSLLFLLAQVCWFAITHGKQRDLTKRLFVSLAIVSVAVGLWVPRLIGAFEDKQNMGVRYWSLQGNQLWTALRDHFGGMAGPYPAGIFIFVLGFIWIFCFKKKRSEALLLSLLIAVPVLSFMFFSCVFQISIAPRYFLISYPFFILLAAAGIVSWPHRIGRWIGALIFTLPLCLYGLSQAGLISKRYIPADYLRPDDHFSAIASLIKKNYDSLDFVVVHRAPGVLGLQYYLDKANESPVVVLSKESDQNWYYVYTNPEIAIYGVNDDLPLLKSLASAGRLLYVDVNNVSDFEYGRAVVPWLRSNAFRIVRIQNVDLYFISPLLSVSGDYKASSAIARDRLFQNFRVLRYFTYPHDVPQQEPRAVGYFEGD